VDTNRRVPHRWVFERNATETAVHIQGRFQVNSARAAMDLAVGGMWIANIPRFALSNTIEDGALVPLLEDFRSDSGPVSAVYLEGRTLPRKVRALIDFAANDIQSTALF
jgi:DNA-binding transcriptional LysR family regulator